MKMNKDLCLFLRTQGRRILACLWLSHSRLSIFPEPCRLCLRHSFFFSQDRLWPSLCSWLSVWNFPCSIARLPTLSRRQFQMLQLSQARSATQPGLEYFFALLLAA